MGLWWKSAHLNHHFVSQAATGGAMSFRVVDNNPPVLFSPVLMNVCLAACLTPSLCVSQVLLCFSRDTTVLDHFKYNSATPPKSYIQGAMMWPFTRSTHTQTLIHRHRHSQECRFSCRTIHVAACRYLHMSTTVVIRTAAGLDFWHVCLSYREGGRRGVCCCLSAQRWACQLQD